MFFVYVISIWALVLTHVFYRTQGFLMVGRKARIVMGVPFYLLGLMYIPARALVRMDPTDEVAAVLVHGAASFVGLIAILWTLLVLIEVGAALMWMVRRRRLRQVGYTVSRKLLAVWWGVSLVIALVGVFNAMGTPGVTRLQVTVPGVEARRIVSFSDIHLGATSSIDQWRKTLQAARDLDPQIVLIPGDLIDDRSPRGKRQMAMIREFFPVEPVYVVTGNHERYVGVDFFAQLCHQNQFRLLSQEAEPLIPGLTIAGIDDQRGSPAQRAVELIAARVKGPMILMAHRPETAAYLKDRPETLIISGHTHGGQLIPMNFFVAFANGGFSTGLYRVGAADLYVSSGAGVWGPPMRILAPSEIVLLQVVGGAAFGTEPGE